MRLGDLLVRSKSVNGALYAVVGKVQGWQHIGDYWIAHVPAAGDLDPYKIRHKTIIYDTQGNTAFPFVNLHDVQFGVAESYDYVTDSAILKKTQTLIASMIGQFAMMKRYARHNGNDPFLTWVGLPTREQYRAAYRMARIWEKTDDSPILRLAMRTTNHADPAIWDLAAEHYRSR